ncbi:outer membrane lipoprotein-sorting protein [Candidatus Riflebacteria bacterium]
MKTIYIAFILATIILSGPLNIAATTAEDKGLQIAREADRRDQGFGDFTANMLMVLKNKHGQKSSRKIRYRTLEVKGDGDKSLTIFDNPRDVKGTSFLAFTHKVKNDDQWLFLPALKRVKRISSRNKSGSFMGSEFAYEDFSSQEVEKYTYRWIRDEKSEGREFFVIERYPVDKRNSGYTRQVVWLDKKEYLEWKIEYYDRKNSLLKTLVLNGYQKYLDKYWRAEVFDMKNHQNGKSTRLQLTNYKFRVGLKTRDFSKNGLKRIK